MRETLSDIFDAYLTLHVIPHTRSQIDIEGRYQRYLVHWAHRPVDEITKTEILRLHTELGATVGKTSANNAVQLLCAIYNKAREWGLITCPNPASGVKKFRLVARERFLERDEIKRFFEAVETLRYPVTRDFLYMCLYTGARRANVASMRWQDISLDRKEWLIPLTKNGTTQRVPLLPAAMAVLSHRMRDNCGSPWVFPSERSNKGHLTKPDKAWKEVITRAGLSDTRIHDLRRTLASWEALTGANTSVIAATLNHRDLKSTSIYARLNLDAVRTAMQTAIDGMCR